MAVFWIIAGSCKGAGKTHLCTALCRALPKSVYLKRGHGEWRADKARNFFTADEDAKAFVEERLNEFDHFVVESHAWNFKFGDRVRVFLSVIRPGADVRDDARKLLASSDIVLGTGELPPSTEKKVRSKVGSAETSEQVMQALIDQNDFLCSGNLSAGVKLWLFSGKEHVFGHGLAVLLDNIRRYGSLQKAAQQFGISYRRAWQLLKQAEEHLGRPLIVRHRGGKGGGSSSLTEGGEQLLEVFTRLDASVRRFASSKLTEIFYECGRKDDHC